MTLDSLVDRLASLESRLIELTSDERVLGQYVLGKIEIFNLWGYCGRDFDMAYRQLIRYCDSYVSVYEGLEAEK